MKIKWFSSIRVLGLFLVLVYHLFQKFFPGGFVGVDIFFTVSGYLITALFIDEYTKTTTIDVLGFFRRRLYRIVPALLLMVGVSLPFALLIRNDFTASIGQQVAATLGFVTNWFEILSGGSYENQFTPHLFLHTWTLALEIQFYILWVLVIWRLSKVVKTVGQLRGFIFIGSTALFILSFLSLFIGSFFVTDYSYVYFSSLTHAFPFFIGSSLATLMGIGQTNAFFKQFVDKHESKPVWIAIASAVGLLLLFSRFLHFDSIWTYLFGLLLTSLATAVLLVAARTLHEWTEQITEPLILSVLADLSYGIYLFHWPFYTIFSQLMGGLLSAVLTLFFSTFFAAVSYYFLEPFLAGKTVQLLHLQLDINRYKRWIWSGIGSLTALSIGICLLAPTLGDFETSMLVNSLHQADSSLNQTKTFAEQGLATSYNVTEGTTIIGDSVTLRATAKLNELLPGAIIDAQGSRNTTQAYEILQNNISSGTLLQNVVIATGVNVVSNYEEELNNIVATLPKGHHLILVTPYDGNYQLYADPTAEKHTEYVKTLAEQYDFITVADWNAVAKANPQIWVGSDNIHFGGNSETTLEGATLYAQTIQTALETAASTPVKAN